MSSPKFHLLTSPTPHQIYCVFSHCLKLHGHLEPMLSAQVLGLRGRVVRICVRVVSKPDTGKFHSSYIGVNACGSAYENGCVVNGTCATAAY